jgi:23S rRNA (pseudouridine1915-N3)-methyltransferase
VRKINIIYTGGMKEKYYKDAVNEYIKRLSAEFKIALCVEGEKLSSEDFSLLLYGEKASNAQSVDFFIGSSHGLSDEVKKSADFMLSFSHMTFPHSLIRVMLMEQIYRAYAIKAGKKYHK